MPSNTENDEKEITNTSTEANVDRETSTEKSSQELEGTTRKNHTKTDTMNTNRPLKVSLNMKNLHTCVYSVTLSLMPDTLHYGNSNDSLVKWILKFEVGTIEKIFQVEDSFKESSRPETINKLFLQFLY